MSTTYTWNVNSMECYPQYESQTNVVFNVTWTATGDNGTYIRSVSQKTPVTYTAGSPYTPYAQLTNEQVIGWVQTALGTDGVQAVYASIDDQILNPVSVYPLPWGAN